MCAVSIICEAFYTGVLGSFTHTTSALCSVYTNIRVATNGANQMIKTFLLIFFLGTPAIAIQTPSFEECEQLQLWVNTDHPTLETSTACITPPSSNVYPELGPFDERQVEKIVEELEIYGLWKSRHQPMY